MVASTCWRVECFTLGCPLITRETVWYETPAAAGHVVDADRPGVVDAVGTALTPCTASGREVPRREFCSCVTAHIHGRIVSAHKMHVKGASVTI